MPTQLSHSGWRPRRLKLGHELGLAILAKLLLIALLYGLFFSPSHRPPADTAAHLIGNTTSLSRPR
jgi:hypothetical protein